MIGTTATLQRQVSLLQQQVREMRQAVDESRQPRKSAVAMAADLGLILDDWQQRALATESRDILLLASRQAGKSTVAGVAALHQSISAPNSLTLIVSPSERQSKRLLRTVRRLYAHVRTQAPPVVEGILSIELRNGSEIHALPGSESTIRGFSAVDLLILDEASRIEDPLYEAVRPMLAVSNGKLMALSTPFGRRGWFWEEWDHGEGWHREKITAAQVRRIDPAWLERERNRIGDWLYDQEYGCIFKSDGDAFFNHDLLVASLSDELEPIFGGIAA